MMDKAPEGELARLKALLFGDDARRLGEAERRLKALETRIGEATAAALKSTAGDAAPADALRPLAGGIEPDALASAPPGQSDATLPEFATKSQDLETLKKAVDDAAAVGGGLWLSYLLALFYLMVAAGSVTHADLFFEKPINLLLLNVQLPIVAFFALAPLLFLSLHAYTLAHLVMLTEKAKRFHKALYAQIGPIEGMTVEENGRRKLIRDGLRAQLPSNVFVQFLAGPPELRDDGFGLALRSIGWSTLAFGPVLLFLLFQVQFLPHHSAFITWTHRLALVADLGLVWLLWRRILSGREVDDRISAQRPARLSYAWKPIGIAASLVVILFSFALATYFGEGVATAIAGFDRAGVVASLHDKLFHSEVNEETLRRRWLLSDALVLRRFDVLDELKISDPERVKRKDFLFIAQNRDLAGAEFQKANLARIDFNGADLTGADFSDAQMDRVSLRGAQLQGASLNWAQLQGASLNWAQLQGASLDNAQLQGASLWSAQLQGASLDYAQLQGASLWSAQLQGASLEYSRLEATDLRDALLWRSAGAPKALHDLLVTPSQQTWGPFMRKKFGSKAEAWTKAAYDELHEQIKALPAGRLRDEALERIQVLDCVDTKLVSCDPDKAQNPPEEFAAWRDKLLAARVEEDVFRLALANTLRTLVCPGNENTPHVVRGRGFLDRLGAAGAEAKPLIADLSDKSSKTCPVAAQLTDADRAKLAEIDAEVTAPTAPQPK